MGSEGHLRLGQHQQQSALAPARKTRVMARAADQCAAAAAGHQEKPPVAAWIMPLVRGGDGREEEHGNAPGQHYFHHW